MKYLFKKYYLLTILVDGIYVNTAIQGSIARWVLDNKEKRVCVLNSWKIKKAEYDYIKGTTTETKK